MRISVRRETLNLAENKVADRNGNPLMISGVVTYLIEDTRRAALDVVDCHSFIRTQATCVMKVVASKYPYEAPNHEPSLKTVKTGSNVIKEEMRAELQRKVAITGAQIDFFELTDLSYAPEVIFINIVFSSWTEFVCFRLPNRCLSDNKLNQLLLRVIQSSRVLLPSLKERFKVWSRQELNLPEKKELILWEICLL
jgi:hypothetical protein